MTTTTTVSRSTGHRKGSSSALPTICCKINYDGRDRREHHKIQFELEVGLQDQDALGSIPMNYQIVGKSLSVRTRYDDWLNRLAHDLRKARVETAIIERIKQTVPHAALRAVQQWAEETFRGFQRDVALNKR